MITPTNTTEGEPLIDIIRIFFNSKFIPFYKNAPKLKLLQRRDNVYSAEKFVTR